MLGTEKKVQLKINTFPFYDHRAAFARTSAPARRLTLSNIIDKQINQARTRRENSLGYLMRSSRGKQDGKMPEQIKLLRNYMNFCWRGFYVIALTTAVLPVKTVSSGNVITGVS